MHFRAEMMKYLPDILSERIITDPYTSKKNYIKYLKKIILCSYN